MQLRDMFLAKHDKAGHFRENEFAGLAAEAAKNERRGYRTSEPLRRDTCLSVTRAENGILGGRECQGPGTGMDKCYGRVCC